MNIQNIRLLMQYIDALEKAEEQLEQMYSQNNDAGLTKVKSFMLDVQYKIESLLK